MSSEPNSNSVVEEPFEALHSKSAVLSNGTVFSFSEIEEHFVRASGPGGQNVNKVSTAVEMRWNVQQSALPEWVREKLLARKDRRLTKDGVLVLTGQRFRSQDRNRQDVRERLLALLEETLKVVPKRIASKPSRSQIRRRLADKAQRSEVKRLRGRASDSD